MTNGDLIATGDLGIFEGGVGRGGGWIRAVDDGVIRIGGNGPPEKWTRQLERVWRADEIDGLRNQTWIGRDGYVSETHLWLVPGSGWPIHRYSLEDGRLVDRTAVSNGARVNDDVAGGNYTHLTHFTPAASIDIDQGRGVVATGDDGYLYGFLDDGALAWSKGFSQSLGSAHLAQFTGDDEPELLVSKANGQIDLLGQPGLTAIPEVWDIPCPVVPACLPREDIDETPSAEKLCVEWQPVMGRTQSEIRAISLGGVPASPWQRVDDKSWGQIDGLDLVPGVLYRVQVGSVDGVDQSSITASDGVMLTNASAPQIELTLNTPRFQRDVTSVRIDAELSDDDRLAGWSITVVERQTGRHIKRIGSGPLQVTETRLERTWDGRDRLGSLVEPGSYLIEVTATDRAGNLGVESAAVDVCAGPCP